MEKTDIFQILSKLGDLITPKTQTSNQPNGNVETKAKEIKHENGNINNASQKGNAKFSYNRTMELLKRHNDLSAKIDKNNPK